MEPSPPPEPATYATDPRIARARRQVALLDRLSPRLADGPRVRGRDPRGGQRPLRPRVLRRRSSGSSSTCPTTSAGSDEQDLGRGLPLRPPAAPAPLVEGPGRPLGPEGPRAPVRARRPAGGLPRRLRDRDPPRPAPGGPLGLQPGGGVPGDPDRPARPPPPRRRVRRGDGRRPRPGDRRPRPARPGAVLRRPLRPAWSPTRSGPSATPAATSATTSAPSTSPGPAATSPPTPATSTASTATASKTSASTPRPSTATSPPTGPGWPIGGSHREMIGGGR